MPNRSLLLKVISLFILAISYCAAQGTLTVYFSPPAAQSSTVAGVATETFDALSTGVKTTAYTSPAGIGTYTGGATNPFAILANSQFGGATDSTHTSPTNYMAVGSASNSANPVILTLAQPAAYFGFWWSAGDQFNRVDLYQGNTLFATFTTQNLLTFLNNGTGTVTAINGTTHYNTSAYFGNPNIASGSKDAAEPFVYISFVITGATINKLAFYNTSATGSAFENDNHSVIFSGNTVTIPTTFVNVETLSLTPTAASPTFSPVAGTYTSVQSVTISSATSGTSIRYTTDGTTPSATVGTLYSGPVTVGVSETINAIAYGTGLANSVVNSAAYTINLPVVAMPTFSPVAGTYTSVQTVTISSATSGASIHYTTDGTAPTATTGTSYSAPVTVGVTETLKAIAFKAGMADSAIATGAYTINLPVVAMPTFSPVAGTYTSAQTVTISSATSGASIHYTTDGSAPTPTTGTAYSAPVTVGVTETLKAIAFKAGMADSAIATGAYTINLPVVAMPTFSPVAGTYTSAQTVTISSATSGASIHYTTDGSAPTPTTGTAYSAPVTVGVTETLKAIAFKAGMADSAIATGAYTINLPVVAMPTFSPVAGTYTSAQTVTISSATSGASIHYTTDGSTPTPTTGTAYSAPVTVGVTETLKAIAFKAGMADSAIATGAYTINLPVVAMPTFSPVAGTYTSAQTVTISSATSGASIHYTTDGSAPTPTTGTAYSAPVTVGVTETLKAIAFKAGMADSAIATGAYTINLPVVAMPTFSPVAGTYTSAQTVTISSATSGASIHYTTDGSTPTPTTGTAYSAPVTVGVTETLKAIAFKAGMADSAIATGAYTINLPVVAMPTFSPVAGTYTSAQTVTISSATSGASIHYTTDGSTPTPTTGTAYSAPVTVGVTETLKAIAFKAGMADSAIATGAYTLTVALPTFSPVTGTYTSAQTVTIATTTGGSSIRYTIDGTTPTSTTGIVYSAPITVGATETVKAIAYQTGFSDSPIATAAYTITPPVAMPTFSPVAGTYTSAQTVTISTTTPGASIHYTTDGTTPTATTGTAYSAPVTVGATETLNAIAFKTGSTDSPIGTAAYTLTVAMPTFSPVTGTYTSAQTVTIATTTGGSSIRYTIDGTTPTSTTGIVYSAPITVGATETVKAIAYQTGFSDSPIATAAYTITPPVAMPTFSPVAGTYTSAQTVTISTTTPGASIHYTTDGTTPTATTGTAYSAPVTVGATETLNAIAFKTGSTDSPIGTAAYTLTVAMPTFSPVTGTYTSAQTVTIATTTGGSSIRYTIDGTTPTSTTGIVYSAPITVGATETVKAIAYQTGFSDSPIATAAYTITPPVAMPTFSPVAGTYTSAQTVTISTTTPGASIHYTTDGTTPTATTGTAYSAPVTVGATETLNAIAFKTGSTDSPIGTAAYTLTVAMPTFSPVTGTYTSAQTVTIATTTGGSSIRYTIDGTTPTATTGIVYSAPITVGATETVKAIAYQTGFTDSTGATAAYNLTVAMPTFTPVAGTYTSAQTVAISSTTSGSSIRYTTDGTTPTSTTGTVYTAPITVGATETFKAIAYQAGFTDSGIATAAYTINIPVTVTPLTSTLTAGQTLQFTATVTLSNQNVTWTVTPATGAGSISTSGLYTAPPCVTSQQAVTITAISVADTTKTASATVTLQYAGGYSYRRAIVVDHTKVPNTDQTNFPVLIKVTDPALATVANSGHVVNPNGYDLVFTSDAACTAKLNYEIETWNPATGQLTAWVQVPLLSHSSDTPIYACYGNSTITTDQSNRTGVWDSGFRAVYHLDSVSTVADSTANANNAVTVAAVAASGEIAGGAQITNNSQAIQIPDSPSLRITGGFVVSAWVNLSAINASDGVIAEKRDPNNLTSTSYNWGAWLDASGHLLAQFYGTSGYVTIYSTGAIAPGAWHHVVVAANDTAGTVYFYIDGALDSTQSYAAGTMVGTGAAIVELGNLGNPYFLGGTLDEVHITGGSIRSGDWIATEYNNQSSPATFATLDPENAPINVTPSVVTLYASQNQQFTAIGSSCSSSVVNWTISSGPGTMNASGLYSAPASITSAQTATVTAKNQLDGQTSGTATVNLEPPIGITVSPLTVTLGVGQTQQFTATLTNINNTAVTWSISPSNAGTITPSGGLYTAPATVTTSQTVTVTAISVVNSTITATATILVLPSAAAPVFSPPPGTYGFSPSVTISSGSSSVSIRYTTDGSTPTETTGHLYSAPIPISAGTTVKAIAYGSGLADSAVITAAYTFATPTSTARFQLLDPITQGSWPGVYGKDGYNVIGGAATYPSYVTVTPSGQSTYVWNSSTPDVRAPESAASGTNRVAGTWVSNTAFNIDLNFTDGLQHQVGLYLLDWDSLNRAESITVVDVATNAILDVRNASNFSNGQYWVWTFSGHVALQIVLTGGPNAVVSGLFFDPPGVIIAPHTISIAPNQTQQFNATLTSSTNQAVTWSVSPSLGSISSTGLYLAPGSLATEQVVTVTAISVADPTKSGSVTVTLLPGVTGGAGTTALSLLASSLCRYPHIAPTVSAGGDRDAFIGCSGGSCTPVLVTNLLGAKLNYTLVPGFALDYSWSLLSGPAPVQFSSPNSITSNVTINAPGNYTLQFSMSDGIATGSAVMHVFVSSYGNGNGEVYLTPAVNGPNAVNTPVSLQATWRNSNFSPVIAGGTIIVTVTGANPQTASIVTDGSGTAFFTYTGVNPGTDTIVAVGQQGNLNGNVSSDAVTVTWAGESPKLTSSPVTGQFFPADGSGTFNITPSTTPAFTQVFPGIDFDPAVGSVPGNTSGVTNQTRPFTNIVTDRTGNYAGAIVAQGDGYQAGVGPLYAFGAVFTGTLNVPSAGQVTFTITSDDGFIFGAGNSATRVSGPQTNTPATTAFKNYAVMGGVNLRSAPTPTTITVNFPAAGAYPYELDYAKGGDNKMTLTMTASGSPIPAPVLLTLTPASAPSIMAGQVELLTLTATDTSGVVLTNLPVTLSVTGVNAQTRLLTTNGVGQVDFAYVGEQYLTGNDTVQAAARVNGVDTYSNAVVITWNNGTNAAPVVSAGTPQTIILPTPAILSGTATDDGLPSASTLAITWTKVTGPGTVTFDNANQANTSASFSVAGSYVLQLSATDGTLTTNSTVAISAINNPNWSSGWIANPLDKSTVTQPVPVTLIPGITLTSGTLTYYPVNSPQSVVTLNANTTGTGQIATFDPTLLNNGSYFVILSATNSVGATMTSQVYVYVQGDYKPGRVTATVTDLKVPASGLPITISRTYDSLTRATSMDFGYGWKLGIQVQMDVSPTADVTFTINGQRRTFYFTPQPNQIFQSIYLPQYTAEPGLYGSLVTTGDNCSGNLQSVGNVWQCAPPSPGASYQPTGYKYIDAYGRIYIVGPDGNLQSLKDLNNNTLTVAANGITSSTGLSVPFVRDTQGRITKITDPLGNAYNYAYDASGNLSTLTLPPNPPVTQLPVTYTYDTTHLLTSEQDSRGNSGSTTYYSDGKLKSVTDSAGQTTSYVYDLAANKTTVTNPDGGTTVTIADSYGMPLSVTDGIGRTTAYTYDANHNELTEQNPNHETTTYAYDGNGFLTSKKDQLGNIWTYVNNPVGSPTLVTDPNGQVTNIGYDANFNLSSAADTIGQVAAFSYNSQGLPLTNTDANGHTSTYSYDQYGNRTGVVDALSRSATSAYDTQGRMTSQTDPRTNKTQYGYDPFGRKTSMADANLKVTTYTYDSNGNKVSETDPLHHTTTYSYDSVNRMTAIQYADGTSKSMSYDFRGNKLTETDQLSRVTKWIYDLAGQLSSVTYAFGTPDAATTSYQYDSAGRKTMEQDPRNFQTKSAYDTAGRLTSTTDGVGNVTTYGYDNKGQKTSMTDAKLRTTNYAYDQRGRLTTTTYVDGKTLTKTYDGVGNVVSVADEENNSTSYQYDVVNQLTTVTDALSQRTSYGYDLSGNKTSQVDANLHTTSYVFDVLNRRTQRTLPGNQSESYAYDDAGNKISHTDFNGKVTTYTYDQLNRLTTRTPDPTFVAQPITFTYTNTGKRHTTTDPSGTTTYVYDNRDRVTSKVTPEGTLTYAFDGANNVNSVVSSNANGTNTGYAWNGVNQLLSVTDNRPGGSGVTNYAYDPLNNVASFAYSNGVTHGYSYDPRHRVTGLNVTNSSSSVLANYTQTFSPTGHKLTVAEQSGRGENYAYDLIYRLTNETIAGDPTSANNGSLAYGLDPVANRQSLTSTLAALPSQSFTYDSDDRLSSDTYDANGNTLSSGGVTYTYDFEDRLLTTSTGVQIVYDGDGNRVSETIGGVTTKYLVDEQTPTGYAQVAEEMVGGSVSAQFVYGRMRVNQSRGGVTSFYGYDAGGSTRQLLSPAAAVTDTYEYDAFGNTVAQTGSTVNEFLYRGEQLDAGLRMYYLRARYYVARTGRFLTADKYEGEEVGACDCSSRSTWIPSIGTHHLFAYGDGDPIGKVDPSGFGSIWERTILVGNTILKIAMHPPHHEFLIAGRLLWCVHIMLLVLENGQQISKEQFPLEWLCYPNRRTSWP